MNSVEDKIHQVITQPKKIVVMSKKLGAYNTPVRMIGHYNGFAKKRLGHYNS